MLGFRSWLIGSHLLLFVDQAAYSLGRPRPLADPVLGALNTKRTVLTGLLWIVRADDLDKFPVAWAPAVGDYDSVVRPILAAFSA